jgi:hypothetical protein
MDLKYWKYYKNFNISGYADADTDLGWLQKLYLFLSNIRAKKET